MKLRADPFRPASDLGRIQRAVERAKQANPYVAQSDWDNVSAAAAPVWQVQDMTYTANAPQTGASYTVATNAAVKAAKSYSGSSLMAFAGSGNAPR